MTDVYLMIGMPGSGKTHWARERMRLYPNCNVWSLNLLRNHYMVQKTRRGRLQTYWQEYSAHLYSKTWRFCKTHAKDFGLFSEEALRDRLNELSYSQYPLFIDNMNLYAPKRKQLVDRCRARGGHVIGVFLDTTLEICIERQQKTRGISREDMEQLYVNMDIPGAQEFDQFIVV